MDSNENQENLLTIHDYLMRNCVSDVRREIERDKWLLIKNPDLLERARTSQMVETLLQLHRMEKTFQTTGTRNCFEDTAAANLELGGIINRSIKQSMPLLLVRWPEVALKIMDLHIHYEGDITGKDNTYFFVIAKSCAGSSSVLKRARYNYGFLLDIQLIHCAFYIFT